MGHEEQAREWLESQRGLTIEPTPFELSWQSIILGLASLLKSVADEARRDPTNRANINEGLAKMAHRERDEARAELAEARRLRDVDLDGYDRLQRALAKAEAELAAAKLSAHVAVTDMLELAKLCGQREDEYPRQAVERALAAANERAEKLRFAARAVLQYIEFAGGTAGDQDWKERVHRLREVLRPAAPPEAKIDRDCACAPGDCEGHCTVCGLAFEPNISTHECPPGFRPKAKPLPLGHPFEPAPIYPRGDVCFKRGCGQPESAHQSAKKGPL